MQTRPETTAVSGREHDTASFGALYQQLQPGLHRYVLRLTADSDAADDICQEAFLRLLRRPDLRGHDARLWIFTVGTNLVRDRGRTTARRQRLLVETPMVPTPFRSPEQELERAEAVRRVQDALATLAERDRQMLMMREEGFRYEEIAEVVGVAPGSVGTLIARALKRFASAYRKDEGE